MPTGCSCPQGYTGLQLPGEGAGPEDCARHLGHVAGPWLSSSWPSLESRRGQIRREVVSRAVSSSGSRGLGSKNKDQLLGGRGG